MKNKKDWTQYRALRHAKENSTRSVYVLAQKNSNQPIFSGLSDTRSRQSWRRGPVCPFSRVSRCVTEHKTIRVQMRRADCVMTRTSMKPDLLSCFVQTKMLFPALVCTCVQFVCVNACMINMCVFSRTCRMLWCDLEMRSFSVGTAVSEAA